MQIPEYECYCDYASNNYGMHALMFRDTTGNRFYFSYKTLVAFDTPDGLIVHKNDWRTTTGRHLNAIDGGDKKSRVDAKTFALILAKTYGAVSSHNAA